MDKKIAKYFIVASLFFFLIGCLDGLTYPTKKAFQSFYASILNLQPKYFKMFWYEFLNKIHGHITVIGWLSSALMGILYFFVPQIGGQTQARYSKWTCYTNLWCHVIGLIVLVIGFHLVGITGLKAGFIHGTLQFYNTVKDLQWFVRIGGLMLLISGLLFSYNMIKNLFFIKKERSYQTISEPSEKEPRIIEV